MQGTLHAGAWKAVGGHRRRCPVVVSMVGELVGRGLACGGDESKTRGFVRKVAVVD